MSTQKDAPTNPFAAKISRTFAEAKADLTSITYDAVVVGSGYGGGIAASRLARTGCKIVLLERGREIRPGDYPNKPQDALAETQVSTAQAGQIMGNEDALYDLRLADDMNVFIGCGLGGTSLVNANVALTVDTRVFQSDAWPKVFRDNPDLLTPYYKMAQDMLGSTPYPGAPESLGKLAALEKSAEEMDASFSKPPINVTFKRGANAAGVFQEACNNCGDCCSGCNYGAKNTTLMNYLPDAKRNGADLVTGASVMWIEKTAQGWNVLVRETNKAKNVNSYIKIATKVVVLAAGTLGSTEILLRTRDKTKLPLSPQLGQKFSGNGDVLAFGYNANMTEETDDAKPRQPIYGIGAGSNDPDKPQFQPGPCITGLIDMRDTGKPLKDGLVIEEGVAPGALAMAYAPLFFMGDAMDSHIFRFGDTEARLRDAQSLGDKIENHPSSLAMAAYEGALSRTQTYLVMSHDEAAGQIELKNGRASVTWPNAGKGDSIKRDNKILNDAADAIWAEYLPNPIWQEQFGHKLISVHPLGGCSMGDDASKGVVNDRCQVFNPSRPTGGGQATHRGLYVCDGAVMPMSLGVNPLLTISAVAERAVEWIAHDYRWEISNNKNKPDPTPPKQPKTPANDDTPDLKEAFAGVIFSLSLLQSAISKKNYDGAMTLLRGMREVLITEFDLDETAIPTIDAMFKDVISNSYGFATTDGLLSKLMGPFLDDFLPILKKIKTALDANNYGEILDILEQEIGDFSPDLSFSERMSGVISTYGIDRPHPISDPYVIAASGGEKSNAQMVAVGDFHISTSSLEKMVTDKSHTAKLAGQISIPLFDAAFKFADTAQFKLLPENMSRIECWEMMYSGDLIPTEAKPGLKNLTFEGRKTLKRRPGSSWWKDLTCLSVDIFQTNGNTRKTVARGQLTLNMQDFAAQSATIKSFVEGNIPDLESSLKKTLGWAYFVNSGEKTFNDKDTRLKIIKLMILLAKQYGYPELETALGEVFLAKLAALFSKLIFRTYGGPFAYLSNFPAVDNKARLERWKKSKPKRSVPAPKSVPANPPSAANPIANKNFALTRFQGGAKGPVILAPGYSLTATSFHMQTNEVTLVEYLAANGYDVWLFDYRGSPGLLNSRKPFTVDDIALQDWPAAVDQVRKVTGAATVQCLGHCVGSLSLLMAMLAGMQGVRSIISSQFTVHPVALAFNIMKADIGLARFLTEPKSQSMDALLDAMGLPAALLDKVKNGLKTLNFAATEVTNAGAGGDAMSPQALADAALNTLLWNVPFPHEIPCYSPTCHRVYGVYGPVYSHENLNEATHNALLDVFGEVSVKPFEQLAATLRAGQIVPANADAPNYLQHAERLNVPVDFISGSRNQIFYPETTYRTLEWLKAKNPPLARKGYYTRKVFEEYGHMDVFIGRNAHNDVFPYLLKCLEMRN